MDFLKKKLVQITGFFAKTDALEKEFKIQETILKASLLNTSIQTLTLLAHQTVKEDLTLRIYFGSQSTKQRVLIAFFMWIGLWVYMIRTQR